MMSILKMLFVILLCVPVAYVALRLITQLIDKTISEARANNRQSGNMNGDHR